MKETRTLAAILYDDFELLDLYGPLEMFGTLGKAVEIVTVAHQKGAVASTQGPQTVATYDFNDCPRPDLVLVPGGIGTFAAMEDEALLEFLRTGADTAQVTMSVCSGSAILAKAGLLEGRAATSNKQFFTMLAAAGPNTNWVESARWVEDGSFVTSSGVSAGTDMALAVIAKLYGRETAEKIAAYTEYTWHTDADIDPFVSYLDAGDMGEVMEVLGRGAA
ncbi:MAG: DJ-1/PfpI family protein [Pseudomonadota bacterium]